MYKENIKKRLLATTITITYVYPEYSKKLNFVAIWDNDRDRFICRWKCGKSEKVKSRNYKYGIKPNQSSEVINEAEKSTYPVRAYIRFSSNNNALWI